MSTIITLRPRNESAGLGIEGMIAKNGLNGETMDGFFELNNGCICCTVKDDLVITLEQLVLHKDKFDYILIEATGVANPGPIISSLWTDEDSDRYTKFYVKSRIKRAMLEQGSEVHLSSFPQSHTLNAVLFPVPSPFNHSYLLSHLPPPPPPLQPAAFRWSCLHGRRIQHPGPHARQVRSQGRSIPDRLRGQSASEQS